MRTRALRPIAAASILGLAACTPMAGEAPGAASPDTSLSFFITSAGPGNGGDLGGLAGADAHCQRLAAAVAAGGRTWRAYLSAQDAAGNPIHARDRIGAGPWFNARGVQVAANVEDLHSDNNQLSKANALTESGATVNGRGDTPNQHDIMTGSSADGRLMAPFAPPLPPTAPPGTPQPAAPPNLHCNNWTSSGPSRTMVGHHDRVGGGQNPTSWNSAHQTRSCARADLISTGGNGYFYCFAADTPRRRR